MYINNIIGLMGAAHRNIRPLHLLCKFLLEFVSKSPNNLG